MEKEREGLVKKHAWELRKQMGNNQEKKKQEERDELE